MSRETGCEPPGPTDAAGLVMDARVRLNTVFWRLAIMLPWVLTAPLGRPVVPEV